MRDSFRSDLRYIVTRILEEEDLGPTEKLERSLACFVVGLESVSAAKRGSGFKQALVSFGYVAASICLWELEQWPPYSGAGHMPIFRAAR